MKCLGPESSSKEGFVAPVLLVSTVFRRAWFPPGRVGHLSVELRCWKPFRGGCCQARRSVAHPSGKLSLAPLPEGDNIRHPIGGVNWSEIILELLLCQCQGSLTARFEGRGAEHSPQRR